MFRNYLAAALRNLVRNKLYALINIAGLAVGLTAAIFAGLYLREELTYDRWVPGHERIYDIATTRSPLRGTSPLEAANTLTILPVLLRADFPQIEAAARLARISDLKIKRGALRLMDSSFAWADSDFFHVIQIEAVAGDIASALDSPDGAVLTRALARKIFNSEAPIGATFEIEGGSAMRVMAVIEDWPSNSSFGAIHGFLSGKATNSLLTRWDARTYGPETELLQMPSSPTYLRFAAGTDVKAMTRELPAFVARHLDPAIHGEVKLRLRALAAVHLDPASRNYATASGGPSAAATFSAVGAIGLLILFMAGVNFVNLMTARALKRAVEAGARKAFGAMRLHLVTQFLGEALLYATLGMIAASALTLLLLPTFNAFLGRAIVFDPFTSLLLGGGLAATTICAGLLAGLYPALVLSHFAPAVVLRGLPVGPGGSPRLRHVLVVVQFAILVALTVAAVTVSSQTRFAMNESLRFQKEEVVILDRGCSTALKTAITALPGVDATACSWNTGVGVALDRGYIGLVSTGSRADIETGIMPLDFGFFDVYGLTPLAGRLFSERYGSDAAKRDGSSNPSLVVNESAARLFGFDAPEAAINQTVLWRRMLPTREALDQRPLLPSQIIGVVPDASPMAARRAVGPVMYYADMAMSTPMAPNLSTPQSLNIKLAAGSDAETLNAIDNAWAQFGEPDRPVKRRFVDEFLQAVYLDVIRQGQLFSLFASVAVFLAALGLFGLAVFTAEQRTKEIGVRKALGANRRDILTLVLWQFAKPVLWANLIAWPAAYFFMRRWLEGFAAHIDLAPWMFLGASGLALAIAITTVAGHALLVARTRPVTALRYE
ncbi:MAG: FtsX-like permease family protein [Rhodospirillaceae bacterium]